jgi:hypothetical protein
MIEKIPFLHRDKLYYIIIREDISFTTLHKILDTLLEQGAFLGEPEDPVLYTVACEKVKYTVGVDGIDVMIACV